VSEDKATEPTAAPIRAAKPPRAIRPPRIPRVLRGW
jgi:hypothetical protein